jgi:hypothetical protein
MKDGKENTRRKKGKRTIKEGQRNKAKNPYCIPTTPHFTNGR